MVVGLHENHLGKLLQNFDRNTYLDYILTNESVLQSIGESVLEHGEIVKSSDLGGNLAFRLKFGLPTYVTLSHPICRFRTRHNYPVRQYSYFASLGLVPVYFASLNRISILKLYGERTENFFSPNSTPLSNAGIDCWEFPISAKPLEYSSMNFLIQNESVPRPAEAQISAIMNKYFTYGFWNWDTSKFNSCSHFLHTREKVTSVINIRKTICVVEELGRKSTVPLEGHMIECREAHLKILNMDGQSPSWEYVTGLLDLDLSEEMSSRSNEFSFLNAIITDISSSGGRKFSILTVIADYGNSHFELLLSFIGIIAWSSFLRNTSVARLFSVMELKEKVYDLIIEAQHEVKLPYTLSNQVQNSFEIALRSLFPMLVLDSQSVLFMHPLCIGLLKSWNLLDKNIFGEEFLKHFLNLLDESTGLRSMRLYTSEHSEMLGKLKISKPNFIKCLIRLGKLISLIRNMDNTVVQ